jgi:hypothetical protein
VDFTGSWTRLDLGWESLPFEESEISWESNSRGKAVGAQFQRKK